ncbi:ABC transporter permease [Hyphomicrobium methylovorum]|nr:ABC transporter permease [Hyphomicrobium methylovorum]MBA2124616.1 ABC transporter permease [Hyphomicrobium methylovorum]
MIFAPVTAIRLAGFARPVSSFGPRLLGAVFLGVGVGIWIGLQFPTARGAIGPAGLVPINLMAAGALSYHLILGSAAPSRRGKFVVILLTIAFLGFGFLEIAHV